MKKEELLAKLEVAKEVTSVVSIDLIISALNELEIPKAKSGITQELADKIADVCPVPPEFKVPAISTLPL